MKEQTANYTVNYHEKGKCPRCNGFIALESQAGPMPPSMRCALCGWREWEAKEWGKHSKRVR